MHLSIPKIFHRIWFGGKPLPDDFSKWGKTWLDFHPSWTMKLWTEKDIDNLECRHMMGKCSSYAQQADLCRYEIIYKFGGVYLDTDMECFANIESLISGHPLFGCWQKEGIVSNAVFGANASNPVMEQLHRRSLLDFTPEPWNIMGPPFFTKFMTADQNTKIFERKTFIPFTWADYKDFPKHPMTFTQAPPGSYAINHRAHIWYEDSRKNLLSGGRL